MLYPGEDYETLDFQCFMLDPCDDAFRHMVMERYPMLPTSTRVCTWRGGAIAPRPSTLPEIHVKPFQDEAGGLPPIPGMWVGLLHLPLADLEKSDLPAARTRGMGYFTATSWCPVCFKPTHLGGTHLGGFNPWEHPPLSKWWPQARTIDGDVYLATGLCKRCREAPPSWAMPQLDHRWLYLWDRSA